MPFSLFLLLFQTVFLQTETMAAKNDCEKSFRSIGFAAAGALHVGVGYLVINSGFSNQSPNHPPSSSPPIQLPGLVVTATKTDFESDLEKQSQEKPFRFFTKEEILKKLRENMESWEKNKILAWPMGELILQSEFLSFGEKDPERAREILSFYELAQNKLRDIKEHPGLSKKQKFDAALRYLNSRFVIGSYCEEVGLMKGFYGAPKYCGNCQSNTKMILSLLVDEKFEIPEGFSQWGAQLYQNHIQPVLINEAKKPVEMITGFTQQKSEAPVYSPSILFHSLFVSLDKKNPPPYDLGELLLLQGSNQNPLTQRDRNRKVVSNTNFEGGKGAFNRSTTPPQPRSVERLSSTFEPFFVGEQNKIMRNLMGEFGVHFSVREGKPDSPEFKPEYLYFSDYDLMEEFKKFKPKYLGDIEDYLQHRYETYLKEKVFSQKEWGEIKNFLKNPIANGSSTKLEALGAFFDKHRLAIENMTSGQANWSENRKPNPEFDLILSLLEKIDTSIEKDPMGFVKYLESLPEKNRVPFMKLVNLAHHIPLMDPLWKDQEIREPTPGLGKLTLLLMEGKKIGSKNIEPFDPNDPNLVVIPIEFDVRLESQPVTKKDSATTQEPKPKNSDKTLAKDYELTVSNTTMASLLLSSAWIHNDYVRAGQGSEQFLTDAIIKAVAKSGDETLERRLEELMDSKGGQIAYVLLNGMAKEIFSKTFMAPENYGEEELYILKEKGRSTAFYTESMLEFKKARLKKRGFNLDDFSIIPAGKKIKDLDQTIKRT